MINCDKIKTLSAKMVVVEATTVFSEELRIPQNFEEYVVIAPR